MMCAGVQNVSLPIDMCHEISHGPPIIPHTTPATMHQMVHGTDSTRVPSFAPTRAVAGGLAICCPNGIDCPIAINPSAATTGGIFAAVPRVYTPPLVLQTDPRLPALTPKRHLLLPNYAPNFHLVSPPPNFTELPRQIFVLNSRVLPALLFIRGGAP